MCGVWRECDCCCCCCVALDSLMLTGSERREPAVAVFARLRRRAPLAQLAADDAEGGAPRGELSECRLLERADEVDGPEE